MPFSKPSATELDRIANEALAAIQRQDLHPLARPTGMTFSDIERTAHAIGQRIAARLTETALVAATDEQSEFAPCPACQNTTRVTRKKRVVITHDGPIEYLEPAAHCLACRRDFFPSAPATAPRRTPV